MSEPTIREEADGLFYVEEMVGGRYGKGDGSLGTGSSRRITRFQTYGEASYYVTIWSLRRQMELSRETLDTVLNSITQLVTKTGRVRTKKVKALVEWAVRFSKPES